MRWRSVIGHEHPDQEKESQLRTFLDGEYEEYWKNWRAKAYVLTEEELKSEYRRSFPTSVTDRGLVRPRRK